MADKAMNLAEHIRDTSTPERQMYEYDIPPKMAKTTGITSVGLVQLTADEEITSAKRARNDNMRLAYELVKASLVAVNGKKVSLADGSADTAWNKMDPKVRALVLQAYAELHNAPEESVEDFLASRKVKVG